MQARPDPLYTAIQKSKYKPVLDRVLYEYGGGDIDPGWLGNSKTYKYLAQIIDSDYEVFDFGCSYATQAFYFRNHAAYHAIDPTCSGVVFQTDNTILHPLTTEEFLASGPPIPPNSFAIVNYVPPWWDQNSEELVKKAFRNVFTFYPTLAHLPTVKKTKLSVAASLRKSAAQGGKEGDKLSLT